MNNTKINGALEWLDQNTDAIASAKGKVYLLENHAKSVKADIMLRSGLNSTSAQETFAFASQEYQDHIVRTAHAIEEYEALRLRKDYYEAYVEAWRSMSANRRVFEKSVL